MLKSATRFTLASVFALVIVGRAGNVFAYHLDDHKRIMLQAMSEVQACYPGKLTSDTQTTIWKSDLDEDLNILVKDTLYSHFYNPTKKLNMVRFDSSVRVKDKQNDLLASVKNLDDLNNQTNASSLGAAEHHIQDMTVPAHVVPVMHGLGDSFEVYTYTGDISSGWSCAEIAKFGNSQDLITIHHETAMLTWNKVLGTQNSSLTGSDFWKPSNNNDFGQYGGAGNSFGRSKITQNNHTLQIDPEFFSDFKGAQMKLAVQQSIKALYWYLKQGHSNYHSD